MTDQGDTPQGVGSGRTAQPGARKSAALRGEEQSQERADVPDGRVRGYTWSERPNAWEVWTEQCANCHLWFEVDTFPPNKRVKSGRLSWCRGCHLERKRQWREVHADYVEQYNKSRREGPIPKDCVVCGKSFLAVRRTVQVRCPDCTRAPRSARPGPSTRARLKGESS